VPKQIIFKAVLILFLLLLCARSSFAGSEYVPATTQVAALPSDRFDRGRNELEITTGVMLSPIKWDIFPTQNETLDYTYSQFRFGWMLNSPFENAGWFRGNFEFMLGLGGGVIIDGPGNGFGNLDFLLRYNFVQPRAVIVPYLQIGTGVFVSDISNVQTQKLVGGTFEADLQTSLGFRFLLNRDWTLNVEGLYQHVSNADTSDRNVGLNAVGGLLGFSRAF
jgi:Lipid A 3-O-deacylase (PagL)